MRLVDETDHTDRRDDLGDQAHAPQCLLLKMRRHRPHLVDRLIRVERAHGLTDRARERRRITFRLHEQHHARLAALLERQIEERLRRFADVPGLRRPRDPDDLRRHRR